MIGAWPGAGAKPAEMVVLLPLGSWTEPQAVVLMGASYTLFWKGNAAGC